jgi:transcriptional regulator with XRE-family HTH domain
MLIGERLRQLRVEKKLSQREVEERSGLLRAYLSRVENGHTIPTVETLQKWAKALEVPMYLLFYEGDQPPAPSTLREWRSPDENAWGSSGEDAAALKQLRRLLRKIGEPNRKIILQIAGKLARRK